MSWRKKKPDSANNTKVRTYKHFIGSPNSRNLLLSKNWRNRVSLSKILERKIVEIEPGLQWQFGWLTLVRPCNPNQRHTILDTRLVHDQSNFICYNCLCNAHSQKRCPARMCSICRAYGHSSIICPQKINRRNEFLGG